MANVVKPDEWQPSFSGELEKSIRDGLRVNGSAVRPAEQQR
jgi:hypothetical protein